MPTPCRARSVPQNRAFFKPTSMPRERGTPPVDPDQIPRAGQVLRVGWYFPLAFAVLLIALFYLNVQPEKAVMWSIVGLLVPAIVFGFEGKRPSLGGMLAAIRETGHGTLDLVRTDQRG